MEKNQQKKPDAGVEQAVCAPRHGRHSAPQPAEEPERVEAPAKTVKSAAKASEGPRKASGAKKAQGPKKSSSKKKKKASGGPAFLNVGILKSKFYRVYFCVVAVALIAILLGMNWLNGIVADYETAQPIHVAEDVLSLFQDGRYDELYGLDTAAEDISEGDPVFYADTLRELTAGKELGLNSVTATATEQKYNVTLDGGKFASFTLVPSGMKSPKGRTLWQLNTVTTNLVRQQELDEQDPTKARFRVKAITGYTVSVDGRQLTDADVVARDVAVFEENFLPADVKAPTMIEYGFNAETDNPVISVTDQSGAVMPVKLERERVWVSGLVEDEASKAKYTEAVETLAKRLARYTTQDLSQATLLSNVAANSPAENFIKHFNNGWAPTHIAYEFNNMTVTDFYMLSENCFTCHVSFEYVLTSVRNNRYPYNPEYTFCIIKSGDSGKLYGVLYH